MVAGGGVAGAGGRGLARVTGRGGRRVVEWWSKGGRRVVEGWSKGGRVVVEGLASLRGRARAIGGAVQGEYL